MDYLSREPSPVDAGLWAQIDAAVVKVARGVLTGRRILQLTGPLGAGVTGVPVDDADASERAEDGVMTTQGRKWTEIPTLYADFSLSGRDLAYTEKEGYLPDLSKAMAAAQVVALREDRLIFNGYPALGYEGLLTTSGVAKQPRSDWAVGENAFADVANAIETLVSKGVYGNYTLVISPRLFTQLQRLQPGTGLLELDRVAKLTGGQLYKTPVLEGEKAVLLCAQPENMDLVVGQDLAAAYLEQRELNHHFRLLESVLLRIRKKQAIVVIE